MSRATKICWTLNNYDDDMIAKIKSGIEPLCKYIVFGKEKGVNGTAHLQGFLILKKQTRINTINKIFKEKVGKAWHCEIAKGNNQQASDYCKKEKDFYESGSFPKCAGARMDIHNFLQMAKVEKDEEKLADQFPNEYVRYYKAAIRVRDIRIKKDRDQELKQLYENARLRPWQRITINKLDNQCDRKVTWVYDPIGNMGKSWLATYLYVRGDCYLIEGGKRIDVAYAYNHELYVVFDFTRSQEEQVNYSLIESFKNGKIFSAKYDCKWKMMKPAKVLCLSNFYPDKSKLSQDRWQILDFSPQSPPNPNRAGPDDEPTN